MAEGESAGPVRLELQDLGHFESSRTRKINCRETCANDVKLMLAKYDKNRRWKQWAVHTNAAELEGDNWFQCGPKDTFGKPNFR